jgi:leucyl-tRNA synthetase
MALSSRYEPHALEEKWQKIWADEKAFRTVEDPDREKYHPMILSLLEKPELVLK